MKGREGERGWCGAVVSELGREDGRTSQASVRRAGSSLEQQIAERRTEEEERKGGNSLSSLHLHNTRLPFPLLPPDTGIPQL